MLPDHMSSNSRSSLAEASKYKSSTLVLKSNGLIVDGSKAKSTSVSSVQKRRLSIDPSPTSSASIGLKSSTDKGSPKPKVPHGSKAIPSSPKLQEPHRVTVSPYLEKNKIKPRTQPNGKDYEALWISSQEELKKKVEQLALLEKEKAQITSKLNQTQKYADESNEKLREALVARKQAEDDLEIEKFRATEMEQTGIEKLQKMEEVWKVEMEAVKNQHALDVSALLCATQQLEKIKKEAKIIGEERSRALACVDEANQISETYAQKVHSLSTESVILKASFDSKLVTLDEQNNKMVAELSSQIDSLGRELEIANGFKKKYEEIEASMDQFKATESHAHNLISKLEERVAYLQRGLKEAEGKDVLIQKTESEIDSLRQKARWLEITVEQYKNDIVESENRRLISEKQASKMEELVQQLNHQLEILQEKNSQFSKDEQSASAHIEQLLEERRKMMDEISDARIEEENSKMVMESLTSALQEASALSRESEEKLVALQTEKTNSYNKLEHMKIVLNSMKNEHEMQILSHENFIEWSKLELYTRKSEWEQRELHFQKRVDQAEESKSAMEAEIQRLVNLLAETEAEVLAAREECIRMKGVLIGSESEIIFLQNALKQAEVDNTTMSECILDKETHCSRLSEEKHELQKGEIVSAEKVAELTRRLEQALLVNENVSTESDSDYDLLPKVEELHEDGGYGIRDNPPSVSNTVAVEDSENPTGKVEEEHVESKKKDEYLMWESCRIGEEEAQSESIPAELKSSCCEGECHSLQAKNTMIHKKTPLLSRFGSILKKKRSNSNIK